MNTSPLQSGVIITDCYDDNARGRQQTRFASLFGAMPTFLSVQAPTTHLESAGIQAAGNLIDQLDAATTLPSAFRHGKSVILLNVATRGDDVRKRWNNGTPFCYAWLGDVLIASTFEGPGLSLARDMGLITAVELMNIPTVAQAAMKWDQLSQAEADKLEHTQFRSLEFLPLVARWIYEGRAVPSTTETLEHLPSVSGQIWFIDNFGNAKTTILPEEIGFAQGKEFTLANGQTATCYQRLADVPQGKPALIVGSSGYRERRFVELVVQRASAARELVLTIGDRVLAD